MSKIEELIELRKAKIQKEKSKQDASRSAFIDLATRDIIISIGIELWDELAPYRGKPQYTEIENGVKILYPFRVHELLLADFAIGVIYAFGESWYPGVYMTEYRFSREVGEQYKDTRVAEFLYDMSIRFNKISIENTLRAIGVEWDTWVKHEQSF